MEKPAFKLSGIKLIVFLILTHLQYIYICSCTKWFAYHCLASVVLKTCIAQFDLIAVY